MCINKQNFLKTIFPGQWGPGPIKPLSTPMHAFQLE